MLNQLITRAYYLNKHLEAPLLEERQERPTDIRMAGLWESRRI